MGQPSPSSAPWSNASSVRTTPESGRGRDDRSPPVQRKPPVKKSNIQRYRRSLTTPNTLTALKPSESEILGRAVEAIQCKDAECRDTWFAALLPRLGRSRALDLAANALTTATRFRYGAPGVTKQACFEALSRALPALRDAMMTTKSKQSDDTFAAMAILAGFESMATEHRLPVPSHMDAMSVVCMRRKAGIPLSEIIKQILDYYYCDMAVRACAHGIPSPLEPTLQEHYHQSPHDTKDHAAILKATGHELLIRLPRLIAQVRQLRNNDTHLPLDAFNALTLANELLTTLEAKDAESGLLHQIGLEPTVDPVEASIISYSFTFNSIDTYEAAIAYWQARLALLQIYMRLHPTYATSTTLLRESTPSSLGSTNSTTPATDLRVELRRSVSNILMSTPFARTLRLPKRKRQLAHGMVLLWGALKDFPAALPTDCAWGEMREWLLWHVNDALFASNQVMRARDVDAAAELFVGGPLEGRYADLYRQSC